MSETRTAPSRAWPASAVAASPDRAERPGARPDSPTSFRLDERVIVLTGGAGLLGSRYARALASAGARIVVADIDGEAAERVAGSLESGRALAARTDVTDAESVRRLRALVMSELGRIDGLVNNAAIDPKFDAEHVDDHGDDFESYPLEAWNASLAVGVTGAFLCTQALAPAMLESGGGSIVNVSSIYGIAGPDQRLYDDGPDAPRRYKPVAYSVAKSAMLGFTRYLAAYYAGRPLRINTLTLGGVENGHDAGFVQRYASRTPLGRMARPDEYGGALVFLLSDASSYMTGASLVVDGGWTAW